jgi:hypothetical protein
MTTDPDEYTTSEFCHRKAKECQQRADHSDNPNQKSLMEGLAGFWHRLAQFYAEKKSS